MGYNVAAAPRQVAWHEFEPGKVKLVIQGSQEENFMAASGAGPADWFAAFISERPWKMRPRKRRSAPTWLAAAASCTR